jgi:hypothetical protein
MQVGSLAALQRHLGRRFAALAPRGAGGVCPCGAPALSSGRVDRLHLGYASWQLSRKGGRATVSRATKISS